MPQLSEQITLPAPPQVVWRLLVDPGLVVSCFAGATLTPTDVHGVYEGTLRVRLGPSVATFRGELRIAYDSDRLRCTVEARGLDAPGQSRAVSTGVVSAAGGDATVLTVTGDFVVTGPIEGMVNAEGVRAARGLLAEFSRNMRHLLTAEGTPVADAEAIPIVELQTVAMQARAAAQDAPAFAQAAELPGGRLLWQAMRSRLLQVFGKG